MKRLLLALALTGCTSSPTPILWHISCETLCDGQIEPLDCRTYCDPQGLTADEISAMLKTGCERALLESGCAAATCTCHVGTDKTECTP